MSRPGHYKPRQAQINREEFTAAVCHAVKLGATTADEVSEMTGLSRDYMAALLIYAASQKRIRRRWKGVYGPVRLAKPLPAPQTPLPPVVAVERIRMPTKAEMMGARVPRHAVPCE